MYAVFLLINIVSADGEVEPFMQPQPSLERCLENAEVILTQFREDNKIEKFAVGCYLKKEGEPS